MIGSEFHKIDSINKNIERTKQLKDVNFRKIDFYINQYKKMKTFYIDLVKLQKSIINKINKFIYFRKKRYQFDGSNRIFRQSRTLSFRIKFSLNLKVVN